MRREELREQIDRYVTILRPQLEGNVGSWKVNAQNNGGGRSSTPLSWRAFDLMMHRDNQKAIRKLRPMFAHMALADRGKRGFIYMRILAAAGLEESDPGEVNGWKAGQTERDRYLAELYDEALDYAVDEFERWYPGKELKVHVDVRDLPVKSGREAQKRGTEREDAQILAELEQIEREEAPISRTEARKLLEDRSGGLRTVRRIQRAIAGPEGREKERERDRRRTRKKREAAA